MTILYDEGDGIVGERVIAYAKCIDLMKMPIPGTHRLRVQGAKLDDAECYIVKPVRWKAKA